MLINVVYTKLFTGSSFLKSFGFCPKMLSRSRFCRRLNRLQDLMQLIFHQLGQTLKELNYESRYALDSFPVALCDNIRIGRNRLTKD
ncbi:MAG: IS982 family transposase, partial [Acidobacteria bacterium]|nr:IS982 family transposase [Acidobacteriota bacterium]